MLATDHYICDLEKSRTQQLCCFHNSTPVLIFQLEGDVAARLLARSGPGGSSHCHDPQQWDTAEEILGLPIWDLHEKESKSLITLVRAFNLVELRWKSLFYHGHEGCPLQKPLMNSVLSWIQRIPVVSTDTVSLCYVARVSACGNRASPQGERKASSSWFSGKQKPETPIWFKVLIWQNILRTAYFSSHFILSIMIGTTP